VLKSSNLFPASMMDERSSAEGALSKTQDRREIGKSHKRDCPRQTDKIDEPPKKLSEVYHLAKLITHIS
jgi:hypothetical protein